MPRNTSTIFPISYLSTSIKSHQQPGKGTNGPVVNTRLSYYYYFSAAEVRNLNNTFNVREFPMVASQAMID